MAWPRRHGHDPAHGIGGALGVGYARIDAHPSPAIARAGVCRAAPPHLMPSAAVATGEPSRRCQLVR